MTQRRVACFDVGFRRRMHALFWHFPIRGAAAYRRMTRLSLCFMTPTVTHLRHCSFWNLGVRHFFGHTNALPHIHPATCTHVHKHMQTQRAFTVKLPCGSAHGGKVAGERQVPRSGRCRFILRQVEVAANGGFVC